MIVRTLLIGLLLVAGSAAAEPATEPGPFFGDFSFTSRKQPIEVTSNHLDFDYKNRRTIFRGGVEVLQGDIVLRSDQLTVTYVEEDDQQKLSGVTAEGNVTIKQGARRATGKRAVFDQDARTLELTGGATLEEGSNRLNGDKIVVYPDESRMEVKGDNSRVKLIIFPGEGGAGAVAGPEASRTPEGGPTPAAAGTTSSDGEAEGP